MHDAYPGVPAPYSLPAAAHPAGFHPAPGGIGAGGGGSGGLDWRQLWQTLLEKGWVVIVLTLVGLTLAWGYLVRSPKRYQSHVVLEVQTQEATLVDVGGPTGGGGPRPGGQGGAYGLTGQEALHTIEQNLRNRSLLVRVLQSENLLGLAGARALLSTPKAPYTGLALPDETLANVLSGMVGATVRRGTRLIDVVVTHPDPTLAQRLAEAVGREFIRGNIERRHEDYQRASSFLVEEAARLKANLERSERAVSDYKARTPDALSLGGSDTSVGGGGGPGGAGGGGGRSSASSRLEELSVKLTTAKAERVRLEGEMAQIEAAASGGASALLVFPAIANASTVMDRRRDLAGAQATVAALAQRYKDRHPKMVAARAALDGAQAALNQAVLAEPALLRSALEQARANETGLGVATKEGEQAALALNRAAIGYQELARQADTDRALYESIIGQIKRTDLAKEANRSDAVTIAEHASLPGGPVSPQPTKVLAAGLLGGLVSGLALIGLLTALDRTVKTVEQAEALCGLPVLAAVPEVGGRERRRQRRAARRPVGPAGEANAALASAPEGPVAEAFRSLRAALALLGPEEERRVVLLTSVLPGEGKSFTSANLALALAQQGQRVLLIDGDLRRPSQGRLFFGNHGGGDHGVVDYLLAGSGGGGAPGRRGSRGDGGRRDGGEGTRPDLPNHHHPHGPDLRTIARPVPLPGSGGGGGEGGGEGEDAGGLWVLPAGRRVPNPAELLGSAGGQAGVTRLVADALQHFDRVIIDSAPVLAVSDTLLLLPHAQTVLVVVHARRTTRAALARGLSLLAQAATGAGARAAAQHPAGPAPAAAAGLVLNRLPRRRGLGYYYYYGQEYSYGQLEGQEPAATARAAVTTRAGREPVPAALVADGDDGDAADSGGHPNGNGHGRLTGTRR